MTCEDIVNLINACKNAGVAKFKFEKLEVTFQPQAPEAAYAKAKPSPSISRDVETETVDDQDLQDLELQSLMINDPVLYETYVRKSGNVPLRE